ncbi:MAG: transposase [Betaproteobacteria bacterium]
MAGEWPRAPRAQGMEWVGKRLAEEGGDGGEGWPAAIALFRPALVSAEEAAERDAELFRRKEGGLKCPRCGAGPAEVRRWGRFMGRQRYRCRGCGRTFTPMTGTPQAYSKHQEKWEELGRCLAEMLTVRQTAERLRIAPSTAFRWRHRVLAALAGEPRPVLRGIVGVVEAYYPECHKGERKLPRLARRREMDYTFLLRREAVCVILARDREGRGLVEPGCRGVPRGWRWSTGR